MSIHVNVIFRNDATQELHFDFLKFTLFQIGTNFNFFELVQIKMYMMFMVFRVLCNKEDVLDLKDHKIIQIFTKMSFVKCRKTTSAFVRLKSITMYSKWP
jgi:hypothetical protein